MNTKNTDQKARQEQEKARAARVLAHPAFRAMARQKAWLGWGFSISVFAVYTAYIWIIGTSPQTLAAKVSPGGVTTWGIWVGMFVIVFSFLITLVYVWLANGKFEEMTQEAVRETLSGEK
ncbi:Inner membrane protein yjcH [Kingella potus]|uniref:Inner membrane protein yjcH n=1 Tax=Kingella potus TaxID=265175 RepID=A0A377R016_9NEIS|nr:DUF485 domain-containing protein [Kingella potus]UOP00789.1 DUF485 domain-containing protein [Kingella potus]STR00429.1 Inner membrane protein yjcH [Kingella potus]